jgi:DNA helicase-2/ATP-dependent DNA helicase PcrA
VTQLMRGPYTAPFASRLSDVESLASDAGDDEKRLNLQALVRLGQDYAALDPGASADGFVAWLRAEGHGDQPDAGTDAVELTTFHRAKGLEWPVVVVAGLENGLVPIGHAHTPEAEAEEQRLMHVALTRAVDELTCTWAERRTFGTRTVFRSPSPYLERVEMALAAMTPGASGDEMRSHLRSQKERLRRPAGRGGRSAPPGSNPDPHVLDALKQWRSATARASGVPAYVIFHDATLAAVAEARPTTRSELLALPGLGPVKAERYGPALLALLAEVREPALASPSS